MKKGFIAVLLASAALIFNGGCNEPELNSSWRSGEIKIDGDLSDWGNSLTVVKDEQIFIGMMNDGSDFYVALSTTDRRRAMQILMNGFTVRFRPPDGKKELGINFPYGIRGEDFSPGEFIERDRQNQEPGFDRFLEKENEFLIVNADDYPLSAYPLSNTAGISIKMKAADGRLNYEIKMPLKSLANFPYYIDAVPGETIEVGFQTKERERPELGSRRGEGRMSGAGGGGRMPGGRRGSGSFRETGGMQQISDLNLWTEVHLSQRGK